MEGRMKGSECAKEGGKEGLHTFYVAFGVIGAIPYAHSGFLVK